MESRKLTRRTERAGQRNVDWRKRPDWREECLLEKQRGLERVILTGGTERTGEGSVDWRNRADWRGEF